MESPESAWDSDSDSGATVPGRHGVSVTQARDAGAAPMRCQCPSQRLSRRGLSRCRGRGQWRRRRASARSGDQASRPRARHRLGIRPRPRPSLLGSDRRPAAATAQPAEQPAEQPAPPRRRCWPGSLFGLSDLWPQCTRSGLQSAAAALLPIRVYNTEHCFGFHVSSE